jgi:hypothetical protein
MSDERDQRRVFEWALPTSLVAHSLVVALLIFGLPISLPLPQQEQAIAVELVPPPKPPEKAKVEPPPPVKQPEPEKPQEQAKIAPPPLPKESKLEKPPETQVEKPPPERKEAARPPPPPKVFRFGEKDEGPRQSLDGDSAEDSSAPPPAPIDPDKQDAAEPPAKSAAEAKNQAPAPEAPKMPPAEAAIQAPEPEAPKMPAEKTKAPKPAEAAKAKSGPTLREAKTLYSRKATDNPVATSAMAGVPRGKRAGLLCFTELREQLSHGSPPYFPELLLFYTLSAGTVMDVPNDAFRVAGQWYNLAYRCEIDADATQVASFAFRVGDPVPRSEWKRRGLTAQ